MIRVPPLACPFPARVHPQVDAVHRAARERWGDRASCATLLGCCHPRATDEDLLLIVELAIWLSDWTARCGGLDPLAVRELDVRACQLLVGQRPVRGDDGLFVALDDVLARLRRRASATWFGRFARDLQDFFEATAWQAASRAVERDVDVDTRVRMRRMTGGIAPAIDLIEIAERVELPVVARAHPIVGGLVRAATNVIAWDRDLCALATDPDPHNLVLAIRARDGSTLDEAVQRVVELHDAEIRHFAELERSLPKFDAELDRRLALFVDGLRCWVRANLDWASAWPITRP